MADTYTSKTEEDLQRRIESIYREAEDDIEKKMDSFVSKYKAKESIYTEKVKSGEISQNDFDAWKAGQVFQGKQWATRRRQIQKIIANSNQVAVGMINKTTPPVFADGANFMAYSMESGVGVNFGFVLCNMQTVERLIKDDPKILPEWKIDEPKDYAWNERKLNNAVTQGIIQGEKLDQISKRVAQSLSTQNGNTMKTFARTAVTGAQNAGAMYSMQEAVDLGIDVEKEWMATFDSHTRDSHADIDGETVPIDEEFSNECMYPGDPGGPPAEVYNCRCTMVANLKKYPSKYERYDNIDGRPVSSMTYDEWYEAKFERVHKNADEFVWNKHYSGTPNRNYGKADTSDALQEIRDGKPNSLSNYLDENGNLTPERAALHKQIIDNYLSGKTPEDGTATMIMMGGGPASGKSSVIRSGLYQLPDGTHTVTIDPDDIKRYLPDYLKMSKVDSTAASFYHEESSMLAKQLASTCFSENFNVVYDGTGDGSVGSVMKKINGAKERGYRVNGMYVTIDTDEALKRNRSRYENAVRKGESPRLVPDAYVIDCHRKVTQISMQVSDKFDSISLFDNNGGVGETKLIATGGSGAKLSAIEGEEKAFEGFLEKGE